ncbi:hypothetical protein KNCP2_03850 [Candidatus Rickettsia kedanie]|uniref:Uncharacterized protein n=1 Tax=Candidatus Rickettsia kedanie TaxID=3115352 RepID=A0ABP9TV03_9RICK
MLTSPITKVKLWWLKLEQFKFNKSGIIIMSNQNKTTLSESTLEFAAKEIEALKAEIVLLLENPLINSDIERIEQRLVSN